MRSSRILGAALALAAAVPGPLSAQGGGEGEPSLFDINTGLSAWTLIVFAGLLFILGKFAWAPILGAVEAREKGIQSALDEAAQRNDDAAKLLAEHREQLADARRQANELIAEGRAASVAMIKEAEQRARAREEEVAASYRTMLEQERVAVREELRRESVELALEAASRLIEENLDQAKDRALVERYLSDLGAGN